MRCVHHPRTTQAHVGGGPRRIESAIPAPEWGTRKGLSGEPESYVHPVPLSVFQVGSTGRVVGVDYIPEVSCPSATTPPPPPNTL